MKTISDKLLKKIEWYATNMYSIRHAKILLELEGYQDISLDFIWKTFKKYRKTKSQTKPAK